MLTMGLPDPEAAAQFMRRMGGCLNGQKATMKLTGSDRHYVREELSMAKRKQDHKRGRLRILGHKPAAQVEPNTHVAVDGIGTRHTRSMAGKKFAQSATEA